MKLNNHNIPMKGIRNAASETRHASPYRAHIQISYNTSTGEIITAYHANNNSWTEYHNPAIIHVINAHEPMSMQAIADAVIAAVA